MKLSSVFFLSLFLMMGAFIPEASAKHHKRCSSSFGLSFNFGAAPNYVAYPVAYVAPAPVAVMPYAQAVPAPMYYAYPQPAYPQPVYAYPQQVIVNPYVSRAYVAPSVSYSYHRYSYR